MNALLAIDHIHLISRDAQATAQWYCDIFAGEITREWYQRYQVERRAIDAEAAADEAEELAEETSEDETAEMPMPEPPVAAMTPRTVTGRPLEERTP